MPEYESGRENEKKETHALSALFPTTQYYNNQLASPESSPSPPTEIDPRLRHNVSCDNITETLWNITKWISYVCTTFLLIQWVVSSYYNVISMTIILNLMATSM